LLPDKDDHALITDAIAYLFSVGRHDAANAIHSLLRDAEVVRDVRVPIGTPIVIGVCRINGLPHITTAEPLNKGTNHGT
jgi:hypothetical protein